MIRGSARLLKFRGVWNHLKRERQFPVKEEPFLQRRMTVAPPTKYAEPSEQRNRGKKKDSSSEALTTPHPSLAVSLSKLTPSELTMYADLEALPPPPSAPIPISDFTSCRQLALQLGLRVKPLRKWAKRTYGEWCPKGHPVSWYLPFKAAVGAVLRFGRGRGYHYQSHDPYLLDSDAERLTQLARRPPAVALVGPSRCGKTAVADALRGPTAAMNPRFGTERWGASQSTEAWLTCVDVARRVTVIDTPGLPAFTSQREAAVTASDVVVLCVPVVKYTAGDQGACDVDELLKEAAVAVWGDGTLSTTMEQCALYRKPVVVMLCDGETENEGGDAGSCGEKGSRDVDDEAEPGHTRHSVDAASASGGSSKRAKGRKNARRRLIGPSGTAQSELQSLIKAAKAGVVAAYGPPPPPGSDAAQKERFTGVEQLRSLAATPRGAATLAQLAECGLDPARHRMAVLPTGMIASALASERSAAAAAAGEGDTPDWILAAAGKKAQGDGGTRQIDTAAAAASVKVLKRQLLWAVDDEVGRLRSSEGVREAAPEVVEADRESGVEGLVAGLLSEGQVDEAVEVAVGERGRGGGSAVGGGAGGSVGVRSKDSRKPACERDVEDEVDLQAPHLNPVADGRIPYEDPNLPSAARVLGPVSSSIHHTGLATFEPAADGDDFDIAVTAAAAAHRRRKGTRRHGRGKKGSGPTEGSTRRYTGRMIRQPGGVEVNVSGKKVKLAGVAEGNLRTVNEGKELNLNKWFAWTGFGVVLDVVRIGRDTTAYVVLPRRGVIGVGAPFVCGDHFGVVTRVLSHSLWPFAPQWRTNVPDFTVSDTTTLATSAHVTPDAAAVAAEAAVLAGDDVGAVVDEISGTGHVSGAARQRAAAAAAAAASASVQRVLGGINPTSPPAAPATFAASAEGGKETVSETDSIGQGMKAYKILTADRAISRWLRDTRTSLHGQVGRSFPAGVPCLVEVRASKCKKGLFVLPASDSVVGQQFFTVPSPFIARQIGAQRRAVGAVLSLSQSYAALLSPRQRRLAEGLAPPSSSALIPPLPSVREALAVADLGAHVVTPSLRDASPSLSPSPLFDGSAARKALHGGLIAELSKFSDSPQASPPTPTRPLHVRPSLQAEARLGGENATMFADAEDSESPSPSADPAVVVADALSAVRDAASTLTAQSPMDSAVGMPREERASQVSDLAAALSSDQELAVEWVHSTLTAAALSDSTPPLQQPLARLAIVLHCGNLGHVDPIKHAISAIARRLGVVVSIPYTLTGTFTLSTLLRAEVSDDIALPVFFCDPQRAVGDVVMPPLMIDTANMCDIPLRVFTHVDHLLAAVARMAAVASGHVVLHDVVADGDEDPVSAAAKAALEAATSIDGHTSATRPAAVESEEPFLPSARARGRKATTGRVQTVYDDLLSKTRPQVDYGASRRKGFTDPELSARGGRSPGWFTTRAEAT